MLVDKIKHFLLLIVRVVVLLSIVVMGGGLCATPLYLLNKMRIIIFYLMLFSSLSYSQSITNIQTIHSFGYWIESETEGYYRLIITRSGFEHLKNKVFVQKIKTPDSPEQDSKVFSTNEISEINNPDIYLIENYDIDDDIIYFRLITPYLIANTDEKYHVDLKIKLIGNTYKVIE